ncbi:hypothetical protein ACHAXT_005195 [Thalassiosira profunda]
MAPPPRKQSAADALLSHSSLASQLQSKAVASAKATAAKKANANNPYRDGAGARPGGATANHGGAGGKMRADGGGNAKRAGKKRPLRNLRGKNDSVGATRPTNIGGGAPPRVPPRAPPTASQPTASRPTGAFARRHARDRASHAPAPPTGTDRMLASLLDEPTKKRKSVATKAGQASGRSRESGRAGGASGVRRLQKRPVGGQGSVTGATKRPKLAGAGAVLAPPPAGKSVGINPKKLKQLRKEGKRRRREDGREGRGEGRGQPPRAEFGEETVPRDDGAPAPPVDVGNTRRWDVDMGEAGWSSSVPKGREVADHPCTNLSSNGTAAEDAGASAFPAATDTSISALDASALNAGMPDDAELMALPLGIGGKRGKGKRKLSRGGASSFSGAVGSSNDAGHDGGKSDGDPSLSSLEETAGGDNTTLEEGNELASTELDAEANGEEEEKPTAQLADWYDAAEQAQMDEEAALQKKLTEDAGDSDPNRGGKRRRSKSKGGVNDNFVRLDLRNSAGACRGARNLKKVNKQKLWRAQHRFGMSDPDGGGEEGGDRREGLRNGTTRAKEGASGGDAKCFASARNAGVDPLDDFMDGMFAKESGKTDGKAKGSAAFAPRKGTSNKKKPLQRKGEGDGGAPVCTRHQRPCKLLTVKKNTKGNKGRKFYACSMPRGEQCDFFKWEEDTVEATQRALLKSSSMSGFITRQVAAARTRFKELTVPELRVEAKKRGLQSTGKKDQILTRLTIWIRDEIANSVEGESQEENGAADAEGDGPKAESTNEEGVNDSSNERSDDDADEPPAATAEEGAKMIDLSDEGESSDDDDDSSDDDESYDELEICNEPEEKPQPLAKSRAPAAKAHEESTLEDSLQTHFGHSAFRPGQEWAIRRCLSHQRTLLVAPTGQGKSLCYALPSLIMPGICIVVSPLISLMQDQLRQLPPKVTAATLSGSITTSQMALIVDDILRGRYKVLFVSPERLASAAFRRLIRPRFNPETRQYERKFPPVSMLCVDEAHCLSQWGHNFRPSYLRVKSLIPMIEPKSILALTATAGPMVVRDICNTLCIPHNGTGAGVEGSMPTLPPASSGADDDGVRVLNCDRDNIDVFSLVLQSNDERRYLLHKILKDKKDDDGERSRNLPIEEGCLSKGSVIVYVWRQKDTEIVAEQLNGAGIQGGVVCYHGGMDSNARSKAQSRFLRGKARICVATVAFGLGINKPDIVGVIHLCLPPSPEHYLQEIGRAGRDGRPAKAIALPLEDEFVSRHSLAHSDRLSSRQIEIVFLSLQKLVDDALSDIPLEAGVNLDADEIFVDGIPVAMPVTQTVDASDCKGESIETIFSLLEEETASDPSLLSVEGYLPDAANVTLKRRSLEKLGAMELIARAISQCGTRADGPNGQLDRNGGTAMEKGFYAYSHGTYKFSVVRCARCMGPDIEPRHVYAALRRLQNSGELELVLDTTATGRAMHLKMTREGINLFRTKRRNEQGDQATDVEVCAGEIVAKLSKQFLAKEKLSVGKVDSMYDIMQRVSSALGAGDEEEGMDALDDDDGCSNGIPHVAEKSARLVLFQKLVQSYFGAGGDAESANSSSVESGASNRGNVIKEFPLGNARLLSCLSSDVSQLMQMLVIRRQEQMEMAVRINEPTCAAYRNLCIAKILHAIDAPRAPILGWYSHHLWGKYRSYSFSSVVEAVKKTFDD